MTKEQEIPTVPPPACGDAYSAETTVCQAPMELLDAIRKNKGGAAAEDSLSLVPEAAPSRTSAPTGAALRRAIQLALLSLILAAAVVTAVLGGHLVGW